jgi:glycosyltransferase involved in cell wall biosynthesis
MNFSPDIIFVGEFNFPEGCAAAFRVFGLGKALQEAGFSVLYLGYEKQPRQEDRQADGTYIYRGLPYISMPDAHKNPLQKMYRLWNVYVSGNTIFQRLRNVDLSATKAIIAYHPYSFCLRRLMRFCRKREIALVTDCTEWHLHSHVPGGCLGPFFWDQEFRLRRLQPKVRNVIAISAYLERYFQSRDCRTIRVPTQIDAQTIEMLPFDDQPRSAKDELRLVFPGSALRERWDAVFEAMKQLRDRGRGIRLDFYGTSKKYFCSHMRYARKMLEQLGAAVEFHGRVPRDEYVRSVGRADFLIMLRDIARWSLACFPTKVPELMAQGLPLITNLHSDFGEIIRDGQDGIVVAQPTTADLVRALERALAMSRHERLEMRRRARQRAIECFDYRKYVDSLGAYMRRVIAAQGKEEGAV